MRLAVISDIHGNLDALDAVLDDLASGDSVDLTWCLGDLAAFGPRPAECVEKIRTLSENGESKTFRVIGGNTDRYLVNGTRFPAAIAEDEATFKQLAEAWQTRDTILNWNLSRLSWADYAYLKSILGRELSSSVEGYGQVIGYHAVPGDDEPLLGPDTPETQALDYVLDREGRLGIGGHTHLQMDRALKGWRLVNVGSVGLSSANPGYAEYGLFTFTEDDLSVELKRVPYDVDNMRIDLEVVGHPAPRWLAARLQPQE